MSLPSPRSATEATTLALEPPHAYSAQLAGTATSPTSFQSPVPQASIPLMDLMSANHALPAPSANSTAAN